MPHPTDLGVYVRCWNGTQLTHLMPHPLLPLNHSQTQTAYLPQLPICSTNGTQTRTHTHMRTHAWDSPETGHTA